MKCITISYYKSYFYFLVYWIISFLFSFLTALFGNQKKEYKEYNRNIEFTNQIIIFVSRIGGDLLAGFLVVYTYLTTSMVTINEKENNIIKKKINEPSKKINRFTLILLVSIIEFTSSIILPIFALFFKSLEEGEIMCLVSITVLSRIFFSHYILKDILYRHHILSLIIFLIGYFFKTIIAFSIGDIHLEKWPYLLFVLIQFILQGLEEVLSKLLLIIQEWLLYLL